MLLKGEPGAGKTRLILHITEECNKIVWVSTLKSAEKVRSEFPKTANLFVVDAHTWERRSVHTQRDIIVQNPINLNEVSLAINKTLGAVGKKYCFILDSISGLLLYHKPQNIIHFLRGLMVRLDDDDASGIFTLTKNAHEKEVEISITMLFDNVLEVENEFSEKGVRRIMKIIKASRYIEHDMVEFSIEKDGIKFPDKLDRELIELLGIR